jgi:serine/threonine-protein kinase
MPQRYGRYVLVDRMGAGGMAEVFRAVVPGVEGFRRELVVKRILSERASSAKFIEMFVHEANISAKLHHPCIVQVFDFGQVDGTYFLAMEMLVGRDLHATMRVLRENGQKFPIPTAAHIAHQIASGLSYAHTLREDGRPLNIVHRDVSPSNVMCLRAGGVKLLDFGVASALGNTTVPDSESRAFRGKLSYAAPEYVRGEGLDARIDLFAVGVILWEMLVGKRLFHGHSDEEKMRALLELPIPPPSSQRPAVSEALDRIVMKALERDPARRYQSAAAMVEDLEEVVLDVKYQPHMLPQLLDGLFGNELSAGPVASEVEKLLVQSGTIQPVTTPSLYKFGTGRTYAATVAVIGMLAILAGAGVAALLPRARDGRAGLGAGGAPAGAAYGTPPEVLPLVFRPGAPAAGGAGVVGELGKHARPSEAAAAAVLTAPVVAAGWPPDKDVAVAARGPASTSTSGGGSASVRAGVSVRAGAGPAGTIDPSGRAASTGRSRGTSSKVSSWTQTRRPVHPVASARRASALVVGRVASGHSIDPFAEAAARPIRK